MGCMSTFPSYFSFTPRSKIFCVSLGRKWLLSDVKTLRKRNDEYLVIFCFRGYWLRRWWSLAFSFDLALFWVGVDFVHSCLTFDQMIEISFSGPLLTRVAVPEKLLPEKGISDAFSSMHFATLWWCQHASLLAQHPSQRPHLDDYYEYDSWREFVR